MVNIDSSSIRATQHHRQDDATGASPVRGSATGQQVGGALGVAAIGIAFFGRSGVTPSFELCLWLVAGLAVLAAVASRFLNEKAAVKEAAARKAAAQAAG